MDDQFTPPPPPPEEPAPPARRGMGPRKIAATALLSVGLLAGSGIGSFVIAHAASSPSTTTASLTATTTTPTATPSTTKPSTTNCPNMGSSGSASTSG
jgi:hypothetical protein